MWTNANGVEVDSETVQRNTSSARYLAVDTETDGGLWYRGQVGVVSVAWGPEREQAVATRNVGAAFELLARTTGRWSFHNVGFDYHFVAPKLPCEFPWDRVDCTLIMSRLNDNLAENHRLKDECLRYFGIDPDEQSSLVAWLDANKSRNFLEAPDYLLLPYAAQDAALDWRLRAYLEPLIQPWRAVYERELQLRRIMSQAEDIGVAIDVPLLFGKQHSMQAALHDIDREIYEAVGQEFNINSDLQLGRILHEDIGLPIIDFTEKTKRPKVDDYCLFKMQHPIAEMVRKHNKIVKAMGYLDSYLELLDGTDRLHPDINTLQAVTSRMSSSNPNIQQVPIHDDEWGIRELFTAESGWFLEVDYSKQELRIAAELAPDKELLKAIVEGRDVYKEMASAGFNIPVLEVPANLRQAAKVMVLARCYGAGAPKLAYTAAVQADHNMSVEDARSWKRRFDSNYVGLARGFNNASEQAKREGQVVTGFNRRLYVNPDYSYKAFNAKIQGTAKDETVTAILRNQDLIESVGGRIIAPVHDSIWLWLPEPPSVGFQRRLAAGMDTGMFSIPATVEMKVGRTWGSCQKI